MSENVMLCEADEEISEARLLLAGVFRIFFSGVSLCDRQKNTSFIYPPDEKYIATLTLIQRH